MKIIKRTPRFYKIAVIICGLATMVWSHYMNYHTGGVVETRERTWFFIGLFLCFVVSKAVTDAFDINPKKEKNI